MDGSGAPYVGAAAGLADSAPVEPMTLSENLLKESVEVSGEGNPLEDLNKDQIARLTDYLTSRLSAGVLARNRRTTRYGSIDRAISTWMRLNKEDTARLAMEDATGKAMPIPFNLPIMASHLDDFTSYFAEAIAPISNPFFTASGAPEAADLIAKLNRDALRRNYYTNVTLAARSLIKYNIGGFHLQWDEGNEGGTKNPMSEPGNYWEGLDMYNTLWDPSIRDVSEVYRKAEWAGVVRLENRLKLMKMALAGKWVKLEEILCKNVVSSSRAMYYKEAALEAGIGTDGEDGKTGQNGGSTVPNWNSMGLGLATDLGPEVDGFEVTTMYCWLFPDQFGLLDQADKAELAESQRNPKSHLELWKFIMVGADLVSATPQIPRTEFIGGEVSEIPVYLSRLTMDQLKEAQRSFMELMRGFQRFSSAMYNIYLNGMRKNVWGAQGYDPQMFDMSGLGGDVVGRVPSKQPGRDVRSGIMDISTNAGVDAALGAVSDTLALKDKFFPTQAMPNNVAGIDRAIKSQVATVVQGTQRGMRMLLRVMDAALLLPTRLGAFRNLKREDNKGIEEVTDEQVSKFIGSGIESMESERVSDALWQLLYAIIQNQEAMQYYDVPGILTYMSRISNLSVDLGQFARQQQQPPTQPPAPGVAPAPVA